MVSRCKAAGVNIYVDGVINHMSGMDGAGTGTAGSQYDGGSQSYPGVPFSTNDFHKPICTIQNYNDPTEVSWRKQEAGLVPGEELLPGGPQRSGRRAGLCTGEDCRVPPGPCNAMLKFESQRKSVA